MTGDVRAACEDEVLELLGAVLLGESDRVSAAAQVACQEPGVAVPFLVTLLVGELRRGAGYGESLRRLQVLALQAKARRAEPSW